VAAPDPGDLLQAEFRVGQVLQHLHGDHHVEQAVLERQPERVRVQEGRSRFAAEVAPLRAQPRIGQVEPDRVAPAALQLVGDHALAAADLQDPLRPVP